MRWRECNGDARDGDRRAPCGRWIGCGGDRDVVGAAEQDAEEGADAGVRLAREMRGGRWGGDVMREREPMWVHERDAMGVAMREHYAGEGTDADAGVWTDQQSD